MNQSLILTVIGPDRTGLVEAVARHVTAHGGNWLESRMARLAGKFAGILRVQVPDEQVEELTASLRDLGAAGSDEALTIVIEKAIDDAAAAGGRRLTLHLVGQDHPGIVHDLSRSLAEAGVNIEELETATANAPMSGETLFEATATLGIPDSVDMDKLRGQLEELAEHLVVDLTIVDPENA